MNTFRNFYEKKFETDYFYSILYFFFMNVVFKFF